MHLTPQFIFLHAFFITDTKIMPSKGKRFNARFPPPRVKKIMQADEDVGKIAQTSPVVVAKAVELFLMDVLKNSLEIAQDEFKVKTITPLQIKKYIERNPEKLGFLKELGETISDEEKKVSRKRKGSNKDEVEKNNDGEVKKSGKTVKLKKAKKENKSGSDLNYIYEDDESKKESS